MTSNTKAIDGIKKTPGPRPTTPLEQRTQQRMAQMMKDVNATGDKEGTGDGSGTSGQTGGGSYAAVVNIPGAGAVQIPVQTNGLKGAEPGGGGGGRFQATTRNVVKG